MAGKKSDLKFIFVHGLSGWGNYDPINERVPYWGFFGGNVADYLNTQGYDCCCASVDPYGSAWDRACELYAQLTGKVVDYGKEHCSRSGHARFGKDFSKEPLMKDFENARLVLIGHSFGGATVRQFSELLRNGSEAERNATDPEDLSAFFKGCAPDKIFAIITLAAPTNGTTAYELADDVTPVPGMERIPGNLAKRNFLRDRFQHLDHTKALWDYADYDMHVDNALALNSRISTFDNIYYFSWPCSSSTTDLTGHIVPDLKRTADVFLLTAFYMSFYTGRTEGGMELGEDWQSNDGLVNEISARAPFGAPTEKFMETNPVRTGVWYVMPTINGDHMHLVGGVDVKTSVDIKPFYTTLVEKIINLEKKL